MDQLCELAKDLSALGAEIDTAPVISVIEKLDEILGSGESKQFEPRELLKRFKKDELGGDDPYFKDKLGTTKALGNKLAPLGLRSKPTWMPEKQNSVRCYTITREFVDDLMMRYRVEKNT